MGCATSTESRDEPALAPPSRHAGTLASHPDPTTEADSVANRTLCRILRADSKFNRSQYRIPEDIDFQYGPYEDVFLQLHNTDDGSSIHNPDGDGNLMLEDISGESSVHHHAGDGSEDGVKHVDSRAGDLQSLPGTPPPRQNRRGVAKKEREKSVRHAKSLALDRVKDGNLTALAREVMDVSSKPERLCKMCRAVLPWLEETGRWDEKLPQLIYDFLPHYDLIYQVITAAKQECGLCKIILGLVYVEESFSPAMAKIEAGEEEWAREPHFRFQLHLTASDSADPFPRLEVQLHSIYADKDENDPPLGKAEILFYQEEEGQGRGQQLIPTRSIENTPLEYDRRSGDSLSMEWLQDCLKHHGCSSYLAEGSIRLPTRLLAIESNQVRVCLAKDLPRNTKYATLSHCWGLNPDLTFQLKRETLAAYQEAVPPQAFSKTFRDAISIALKLGFKFLWIDSLCIIQEDEVDFRTEAGRMADIFSNSSLNIAASGAANGSEGCLFDDPPFRRFPRFDIKTQSKLFHCFPMKLYQYCFNESPIASRAWCFQERVLAPRTLFFGKSQMFWECRERLVYECCARGFLHGDVGDTEQLVVHKNNLDRYWQEILRIYTGCKMSQSKDKLVAFAGVLRKMENDLKDACFAGIWGRTFERSLLWYSKHPVQVEIYRAPSWSWAAIDGEIITPGPFAVRGRDMPKRSIPGEVEGRSTTKKSKKKKLFTHLLSVDVKSYTEDHLGELYGGEAKLCCKTLVKVTTQKGADRITLSLATTKQHLPVILHWDSRPGVNQVFYILPISEALSPVADVEGLVLASAGNAQGKYLRAGHFVSMRYKLWNNLEVLMDPKNRADVDAFVEYIDDERYPAANWVISII